MKNKLLSFGVFALTLPLLFTFSAFDLKGSIKKADYKVTIINKYWNSLHLQVRAGNNSIPENNVLVRDVVLKKGESISVDYDVLCYYRRDADPDRPDGKNFTTWTAAGCSRNQPCTVDNP